MHYATAALDSQHKTRAIVLICCSLNEQPLEALESAFTKRTPWHHSTRYMSYFFQLEPVYLAKQIDPSYHPACKGAMLTTQHKGPIIQAPGNWKC